MLNHFPQLRLTINTLVAAVGPITNIVLISLMFMFFYAIVGVQMFEGAFYNCMDTDFHDVRHPNITDNSSCLAQNFIWKERTFNFDNLLQALLSLFVMYSKDGWVNIMYDGIDAVGPDIQPITQFNPWRALYFILFMITCVLLLDMFIGTLVDTWFLKVHQERELQRQKQKKRRRVATRRRRVTDPAEDRLQSRYFLYFEWFVRAVVAINLLVMAFDHYGQPKYLEDLMRSASTSSQACS
ncbi:hypothetical protein WMY93_032328 [Mugilogobius chulae]|uniref:Ion transport domain-containing protein n=1 Tax=Mugilogobius chulae TaxID=88201 RepID=A0AAW0MJZ7_9GOBI